MNAIEEKTYPVWGKQLGEGAHGLYDDEDSARGRQVAFLRPLAGVPLERGSVEARAEARGWDYQGPALGEE